MCWQKTATARGEARDGGGGHGGVQTLAASRLRADRDHTTQLQAQAAAGSQSRAARAAQITGRATPAMGLPDALPGAAPRRLAGKSQAGRALVPRRRAGAATAERRRKRVSHLRVVRQAPVAANQV